jgi:hypothetical protein
MDRQIVAKTQAPQPMGAVLLEDEQDEPAVARDEVSRPRPF